VPLLRFILGRRLPSLHADIGGSLMPSLVFATVSMDRAEDLRAVMTLAARCQSADPGRHFAPAGLVTELNGRPGRAVHAWVAWPTEAVTRAAAGGCVDSGPLGLVALVAAGEVPRPRFSLAWLLVHPDARRRGVATALVGHAVAHAESLGATKISAETLSSWPAAVGFWRSVGCEQDS
jgi:ribosomal protein S18 acetylase RimI-like enzyme